MSNDPYILEIEKLKEEVNNLRHEKQLLYYKLLQLKNDITNHFDTIGKTHFSDDYYEED